MSNRNREAGHSFERDCAKRFREIGFTNVQCSRAVNRARDAQKVDLANEDESVYGRFPFNVQCKNTTTLNYVSVLKQMPLTANVPNVIFHKLTKKSEGGKKFISQGNFCFLHMEDFLEMVETIQNLKKEVQCLKQL
jgi:hypothetical protein